MDAVDISPGLIERARNRSIGKAPRYMVADARRSLPAGPFDVALCLYDVLGSSANSDDDYVMLQNIARVLVPGGKLVAGVMNTAVTLDRITHRPRTNEELIEALERLPASNTMEASGNVFEPKLLLYYDGVYYRKEQFAGDARRLPAELVVRDRRFSVEEVRSLFERAGLIVDEIRPSRAGSWSDPPLHENDPNAKELLVVAHRSRT